VQDFELLSDHSCVEITHTSEVSAATVKGGNQSHRDRIGKLTDQIVRGSAQHLLDRLPSESELGCILLDVRIPGLSGPELQSRLNDLGSSLPIVFLTGHPDVRTTVRTIKAGAEDFLTKPGSSDDLLRAIKRTVARREVTRGRKVKLDAVRSPIATMTPREREVFELIFHGKTNKQAGNTVGSTQRTIKAHGHRVMEQMQVRSVAERVSLAEWVGVLGGTSGSRQTT
jgi:FixJ family two-component response regulator